MKSMVKTFLVLNLVLCAVVLGVSYKTFMDREVVKARTVIHRQQLQDIATQLAWGVKHDWEQESKAGSFQLPDPSNMDEFGAFTTQLEELTQLAEQRVSQLSVQFEDLTKTQGELEETRTQLAARVSELSDARGRVTNLENGVANNQSALRVTNTQIATLTRENEALQQQVDSLDSQITDQQTLISQVQGELDLRSVERDKARDLLAACLRPTNKSDEGGGIWTGRAAKILAVEPQWNYVVIDKGEVDVLPMFLEALVHRGEEFVGKVRVMQVDRTVALAEIMNETLTPGMTLEAGDTIFFN